MQKSSRGKTKNTNPFKKKKKKDMMGNTRNPNIHKVGIKFGIDKDLFLKKKNRCLRKK